MKVFVGLSHKGGTGRSVTIANVAYHLAVSGRNVCIIDLDLASPTMGAILGIPGLAVGAKGSYRGTPKTIGDLLQTAHNASRARQSVVEIWDERNLKRKKDDGNFGLIPGEKYFGDSVNPETIKNILPAILLDLGFEYDIVFLDARSGISSVVSGLAQANAVHSTSGDALINGWLIHFRWTEQHLYGVEDLLGNPQDGCGLSQQNIPGSQVFLIRTAFIDPDSIKGPAKTWFNMRHEDLEKKLNNFVTPDIKMIGSIPLDPILQWRECIITQDLVSKNIAKEETYSAFLKIAKQLESVK